LISFLLNFLIDFTAVVISLAVFSEANALKELKRAFSVAFLSFLSD